MRYQELAPSPPLAQWVHCAWIFECAEPSHAPSSACRCASPRAKVTETWLGLSYFASPGAQPPTEFKLKEAGERRVVFENAAHDFPQRILYWREGESLVARIEGTIKGEAKQQEWRFAPGP